jgi:hypothetical protein
VISQIAKCTVLDDEPVKVMTFLAAAAGGAGGEIGVHSAAPRLGLHFRGETQREEGVAFPMWLVSDPRVCAAGIQQYARASRVSGDG